MRLLREPRVEGMSDSKLSDRSRKVRLEESGARLKSESESRLEDTRWSSRTSEPGEKTLSGR